MLQETIEREIAKLGLRRQIALLGYLPYEELRLAYAAADVLIVPSDYEPFGLVALEGQRVGTPVIVSDVGGLAETIRRTGGGLTFPTGNSEVLCERISSMLADPALRTELGKKGQANTNRRYNWNILARDIDAVYDVARKMPPPADIVPPEWARPTPAPNKLKSDKISTAPDLMDKGTRRESIELKNIIIFWQKRRMVTLKLILERLADSHALKVLDGYIYVVPVSEAQEDIEVWVRPLEHDRIEYIQPESLSELWADAACALADADLAEALQAYDILAPQHVPTVWIGRDVAGHGWSANSVDEIFALVNKLLCDNRLRSALANAIEHSIVQIPKSQSRGSITKIMHILPQIVTGRSGNRST